MKIQRTTIEKETKLPHLNRISVIVQMIIGFLILATVGVTSWNVIQQHNFNRISMRPWISVKPLHDIKVETGCFTCSYSVACYGRSPACDLVNISDCNFCEDFPDSSFKEVRMNSATKNYLVPDQQLPVMDRQYRLRYERIQQNPKTGKILCVVDTVSYQKESILDSMEIGRFFLFIYIEYKDHSNYRYGLKATFQITDIDTIRNKCNWKMIRIKEEVID